MNKYGKFAVLMAIIVGSLGFLAYSGIQGSTTYYKTIAELRQMGGEAQTRHVRVGGDVVGSSIVHEAGIVKFNLVWEKQTLRVAYEGRDPLPDTFRDGAQALADGKLDRDGIFRAAQVQAKCASKYEAKPGQLKPGAVPPNINAGKSI
jgi:cytochrome c-type biogenesis protein CcmE